MWRLRAAWEFSSPQIVTNQHIAIIGMFFGEVTVDSGHFRQFSVEQTVCTSERVNRKLFWRHWCGHVANLQVKDVIMRPHSKYAIEVLDRSHRCISHVRLVRTTRQCLEEARSKFCVAF